MYIFIGIQCGSCGYKLQQLVRDDTGKLVQKTSEILFWVVYDIGGGRTLYIPFSKIDLEQNNTIVPAQILASYHDRTRTILKKTPNGTTTIPFGGIII